MNEKQIDLEQRLIRDKTIHVQDEEFCELMEAICSVHARYCDVAEWRVITPSGAIMPLKDIFERCINHLDKLSEPFVIASVPDNFRQSFETWEKKDGDEV